ncbi:WD40 repeat domain-containing protein [Aspergillus lucknowensis]|uniref:DUF7624 domain-containing protein n=1 Tax=Aspergillus lucknowensis TaxID=176173 RepID=A0ABR4LJZ4_9EURO
MPTTEHSNPSRCPKRSRASDEVPGSMTQVKRERVKRRRTSADDEATKEHLKPPNALSGKPSNCHTVTNEIGPSALDKITAPPDSWSLSQRIGGQFTNLDPILTPDEQYLLLSLETSIHVYSVATSRLFRVLEIGPENNLIGYRLSPANQKRLYIFTSSGSVSEWDWPTNKKLAQWSTHHKTLSADLVYEDATSRESDAHIVFFALRERKDGKKELVTASLDREKPQGNNILEANPKIDEFRVIGNGQIIVAYGGARILVGSLSYTLGSEFSKYVWREVKLGVHITCVDIKPHDPPKQNPHRVSGIKMSGFDLVLGAVDGSILVYHDVLSFLGAGSGREEGKTAAPRRLHWHRDPVRAVRWSKDGNYVISGGHEPVMVLWQLDSGRKQFLPHLSSPIRDIVVSSTGNSYVVKLADNRVVVLSARELQPLATITGLQAVAATLHPRHSEKLLITVPAYDQPTQDGVASTSAPMLQIFDIRSNTHVLRQALARTNATTLNIGPGGTPILTPDVKHLSISQDGEWMATIDSWSPYPQDTGAPDLENSFWPQHEEIYMKFWRWSESSSLWELVTRIDKPHLSEKGSASVLDISSRPHSHEFSTIGADALLRFWRPITKQRHGLSKDPEQVPETYKCRNTIDLSGYLNTLSSASVCFSEDGSVLAACLQSTSLNSGLTLLLDARSGTVKYSKARVYSGNICATAFLGYRLIIATDRSVFVWDTVNDVVKSTGSLGAQPAVNGGHCLLAVNPRTDTFATTSRNLQKKATLKKHRKPRFTVQLYDVNSMSLLSSFNLMRDPIVLLSNLHSAEYVIVDAAASVQKLGRDSKTSQVAHADESIQYSDRGLDRGLENLFGRQSTDGLNKSPAPAVTMGLNARRSGLAGVFGDTPPFILPPSRIIFRDLVKALSNTLLDAAPPSAVQVVPPGHTSQSQLTVQTTNPMPSHSRNRSDDDELPKSVIHAPAGFSEFKLNVQKSPASHKPQEGPRSSSTSPMSINVVPGQEEERTSKRLSHSPISPPPLTTAIEPAKNWSERATPRAQTRQDFDDLDRISHSSNLEDIPEGFDNPKKASAGADQITHRLGLTTDHLPAKGAEIKALQAALVECWSLCNTLATLSSIHRERTNSAVEAQDDAWESCWRLCQQLYAGRVDDNASQVNPTLDLCRDFCQTLFETRARDNEISDSVLRVSFELNNHLYNTHDRNLPDAFRERTLDFYITLCHRLMKQRTREPETDSLLSACWSLAEMLFSIRQSKKEGRPLDEELLGSAVQACWELCDIFREGWTKRSLRNSDRGTPRPSQATFPPAEKQTKQSDIARGAELIFRQRNPETPTTIFEDVGTISPEEGPVQNIFVLGQRRNASYANNWPSSASSVSGRTQSSERTSSTNTVVSLSNEANLASLRVLISKAAMNNGFQRNGSQSLSTFVKSLSSDAFGSTSWQAALLKQYKGLVAFEPAFQSIGPPSRATAMDIARAVKIMAQSGQYLWLYDLYRFVFGFHVEEVMNRETIVIQT